MKPMLKRNQSTCWLCEALGTVSASSLSCIVTDSLPTGQVALEDHLRDLWAMVTK